MIIGYDIDGILSPDPAITPDHPEWKSTLAHKDDYLLPNFIPDGKYILITGRHNSAKQETLDWAKYALAKNPPQEIFCDGDGTDPARYKAHVLLNNPRVFTFFESEFEQVVSIYKILKGAKSPRNIVHWDSFIRKSIHNLIEKHSI